MQSPPSSASYRNYLRTSLRNTRGEFPENVQGPDTPASAFVEGRQVKLGVQRVSRHKATTGRSADYVIVDVSDDAMHCMQLAPMLKRKLAEGFSRDSGNVLSHIIASNGKSNWLLLRVENLHDLFDKGLLVNSLREGSRKCQSLALATQAILIEHYASQPNPQCVCIERVQSEMSDHAFVRVLMKDGSVVVHDQWINPEAFLAQDGRFGTAGDLLVRSRWRPGDVVPQRWEELKQQALDAGGIQNAELKPSSVNLLGDVSPSDLTSYLQRTLRYGSGVARQEADCLLTDDQAAERGLLPNEKIAYHCGGAYYSNDVVNESSVRQVDMVSFVGLFLAEWEAGVREAFNTDNLHQLTKLLQRSDIREAFPSQYQTVCCRVLAGAMSRPSTTWSRAIGKAFSDNGGDAWEMSQKALTYRMQTIEYAVMRDDVSELERTLRARDLEDVGDLGAGWLTLACNQPHVGSIKHLLKSGAQFGAIPIGALDALVVAIREGDTGLVQLLFKSLVSALRAEHQGTSPWYIAQPAQQVSARSGVHVVQRAIIKLVCLSVVTETLAHGSAERLQLELLKAIEGKAIGRMLTVAIWHVNLETACSWGDTREIQRLLASHYSKADRDVHKVATTLLYQVIEAKPVNQSVVKALVDGGVDINRPLKNGKTPLLAACGIADVETVSLLIQAGAVIDDSSCWDGFTALGHACRTGSLALTRLLLERGASPIKVDSTGWSPVAHAQMFSMSDFMDPMYGERVQLLHELENAVANLAKGELQ